MRVSLKYFFLHLIFFLFLFSEINAKDFCDFSHIDYIDDLSNLSSINSINIEINNYRKWKINALSILTDRDEYILQSYKKRFKALVSVKYPFGTCKYNATVRQHGDFKDHIAFSPNFIDQSLDIKLEEGNVAGVVKFKLLLPSTRGANSPEGKNEIIATFLLS